MAQNNDTLESQEYFEKRELKKGSVGWVLLVGLGVAYVISGDFSGWNYGMANGGWLGLAIAFAVIAGLCFMACYLIRRALLREKERKDASK